MLKDHINKLYSFVTKSSHLDLRKQFLKKKMFFESREKVSCMWLQKDFLVKIMCMLTFILFPADEVAIFAKLLWLFRAFSKNCLFCA